MNIILHGVNSREHKYYTANSCNYKEEIHKSSMLAYLLQLDLKLLVHSRIHLHSDLLAALILHQWPREGL